jgi:hypothetical protein
MSVADWKSTERTSAGDRVGSTERMSKTAPAVMGAAKEVPLAEA